MIGFECPWCEREVRLQPQALSAGSIVCPECRTQVDMAVAPSVVVPERPSTERELALAA